MRTTIFNSNTSSKINHSEKKLPRNDLITNVPISLFDLKRFDTPTTGLEKLLSAQSLNLETLSQKKNPGLRSFNQSSYRSIANNSVTPPITPLIHDEKKSKVKDSNSSSIQNTECSSPALKKFDRKEIRSRTEINKLITTQNMLTCEKATAQTNSIRKNIRNKTELLGRTDILNKKIEGDKKKKGMNYKKSDLGLSNQFKIESTPSRVHQKEKVLNSTPELLVKDIKFNIIETEEALKSSLQKPRSPSIELKEEGLPKFSSYKHQRRSSTSSINFSEAHNELLYEIANSVNELNYRLLKTEEVNITRLNENISLRNTLKHLENRLEEEKNKKHEEVNVGCTNACRIF